MATSKLQIRWLCNAVGGDVDTISIGVCEKQPDRISFISPDFGMSALVPMIVRDLYITGRGCEEGKRCLVIDCPFNCTTFTSYKNSASWKRQGLPRKKNFTIMLERVKEWESMLKDEIARIDWKKDLTYCYTEPILVLRKVKP